jgi:uncharacterized membrane protein YciS (DUF1049 family)
VIGTAFYVLGVIACMFVIVVAAIALIVNFELVIGLVGFLALLWFAWWVGLSQILLAGAILGPIIGGLWWLATRSDRKRRRGEERVQQERWEGLDKRWNGT